MLLRHIIGYTPSLVVPALTAFVSIFAYTRLLSPAEYGRYALALNTMNLLNAVFFFWLQVSLPRLMPQAIKQGQDKAFRATAYSAYGAVSALVLIIGMPLIFFSPFGEFHEVVLAAIPLALARSILNLNESFHRSYLDFKKYNIIECGQAIAGLILGLLLVTVGDMGNLGANMGMVLGMLCMLSVDIKTMLKASWRDFDPNIFKEIVRFAAPLVGTFGLSFIIASSDRYFVSYFQGAADVGIYSAGYTLVDRIVTMLFMAIVTPSFPLLIQRLEMDGEEAAQNQMCRNGVALMLLILPACAGLLLTSDHLVSVLVGEEFREGATKVVPWIVGGATLNGFASHYFCHTFHLVKRPDLLFWTQLPIAGLNLLLNILLIPSLGYMGAAYATLISYVLLLALNVLLGFRVFPFPFPLKELFQILAAVAVMSLFLEIVPFPFTVLGLVEKIAAAILIYGLVIVLINIMNARTRIHRFGARILGLPLPSLPDDGSYNA